MGTAHHRKFGRNQPLGGVAFAFATVVLASAAVVGCTGTNDAATSTTAVFVPADVPAGAAQTPFCSGMSAISLRVNTDPPNDLTSYLIAEYEALLPVVPPAIASEFETVLGNLRNAAGSTVLAGAATATTAVTPVGNTAIATGSSDPADGFLEEGYLPDAEPSLRLNAYLADQCFGTQSNPGPPPTQPLSDDPSSSDPTATDTG